MNLPGPSHEASEAVLVDVLDELTARINAGESFDLAEYEQRLPGHIDQIRKLAATLKVMAQFSQSPPSAEKPEGAPKRLGDFRILRELGRGGMGIVYEAEQVSLRRPVALKVLPYAALMDERAIQRFRNEARAAALLDHPHIVPVHAVSAERGVHFYAMSLIHGLTLAEVIAEMRSRIKSTDQANLSVLQIVSDNSGRPDEESQSKASGYEPTLDHSTKSGEDEQRPADFVLDIPNQLDTRREVQAAISTHRGDFDTEYFSRAARIGVEAAEALDHAHQHGILHRDVKPGNLMIDGSGKTWITDFGLARIGTDAGMTATGDLIGTVRYMAPEQALAKRVTIDHRADIYSLGVTLYELLTLQPAFDAPDREAMLKQIAFEEPRLPRRINPVIPRELEVIVLKAMAKHPNDRFETAQELADDVRRFLDDEPIRAKPPTLAQRATRFARRHKPLVTSAVIILLLTTVGLAVGNVLIAQQRNRAEEASAEAKKQTEIAQQNFQRARDAVDQYLTKVSEDELLNNPGLQPLRKDLLELALKYYQEFIAERGDDPALQADLAAAYFRVGTITKEVGSAEDALTAYQKALEIRKNLVAGNPDRVDFQSALGNSYLFVGLVQKSLGMNDEALFSYQKAREINEVLAADNPRYLSNLATLCDLVGTIQRRTDKSEEAIISYQKAIKTLKKIKAERIDVSYRWSLAGCYHNLGIVQELTGKPDEAIVSYQKAIEISVALAREDPAILRYQARLAKHYTVLGSLKISAGKHDEASAAYRKAIAVQEKLVAENPEVTEYGHVLALSYGNLGDLKRSTGKPEEAFKLYSGEIDLREKLVAKNPGVVDYQSSLAGSYNILGLLQQYRGKPEEAVTSYEKAIGILVRIAADNPKVYSYQYSLAGCYNNLGAIQSDTGRSDEAISSYQNAIGISNKLVAQCPQVPRYQNYLTRHYTNLATVQAKTGMLSEAITSYQNSLSARKRIAEDNPASIQQQAGMAFIYNQLSSVQRSIGKTDEAYANCQKAVEIGEKLVAQYPQVTDYQFRLAQCYENLGDLQREAGEQDEAIGSYQKRFDIAKQLLTDSPTDLRFEFQLISSCISLGSLQRDADQTEEAYDLYEKAITLLKVLEAKNPAFPQLRGFLAYGYTELGCLQRDTGRRDEAGGSFAMAIDVLQTLLQQDVKEPEYRHVLARAYLEQGYLQRLVPKPTESMASYEQAVATWVTIPQSARTVDHWEGLAEALYRVGRWDESREALETVIEMRGEDAPTLVGGPRWWFLTMALANLGEQDKARSYYDQLAKHMSSTPVINTQNDRLRFEAAKLLGIEATERAKEKVASDVDEKEKNMKGGDGTE